MRIRVLSPVSTPHAGGVFVADLCEHLAARGHDVTLVTSAGAAPIASVDVVTVGSPPRHGWLARRAAHHVRFSAHGLAAALRGTREADVLVVAGSPPIHAAALGALPRAPACSVIHWVMDLYPEALRAARVGRALVRTAGAAMRASIDRAWTAAAAVVAITPGIAAGVGARAPSAKVVTIPLWAPKGVGPREDRGLATRRTLRIDESAFVVLYAGNFGLAYDFAPLVRCAASMSGDSGCVFVLAGSGARRDEVARDVAHLPNVRLADPVPSESLPDLLACGDLHVVIQQPGWSGVSFPSKVVASLATGRAVAAIAPRDSEVGRLAETSGFGVTLADEAALARFVGEVRSDAAALGRRARAARATYERDFDRAAALDRWESLMELRS